MRISDWSSDVCSSDLGSVCAFHLDRLLRRSLQPPLRVTLGYISSGQAAGILDVSSGISRTQRQFDLVQARAVALLVRSEEHTSELQSLMRISYAVFCLKKKNHIPNTDTQR